MAKQKTNGRFFKDLVDGDPLAAMLVVDAVTKFANAISKSKPEDLFPVKPGEVCLIDGAAYVAAAKRVKAALAANYGG